MSLHIFNDVHIGAVRTGGTTPATAYQLRQDLLDQFAEAVQKVGGDLMLLGDLFDGPNISRADLLRTFGILSNYLERAPSLTLYLVNGNHDLSKDSTNFSSFELLAHLLVEVYGAQVRHITTGTHLREHDMYVIPHVTNQDLFNVELSKVPACRHLAVHCNYDNQFAVESDHSLNLSKEQAEQLPVEYIIFAHEHQGRTELGGKVVIIGNQWPSSVSDCLGRQSKSCLRIVPGHPLVFPVTWEPDNDFAEVDWLELPNAKDMKHRFIRVTGVATPDEASLVASAIARFRNVSPALVITNAVKIESRDDAAQLELSHEEITSFNVHSALQEYLTPEENQKINSLLEKKRAA